MTLLCYYDATNNINNIITLIRGSNVIFSARFDILLVEVKQVICGGIWWNYNEMKVCNIPNISVLIFYNKSKNSIIVLIGR